MIPGSLTAMYAAAWLQAAEQVGYMMHRVDLQERGANGSMREQDTSIGAEREPSGSDMAGGPKNPISLSLCTGVPGEKTKPPKKRGKTPPVRPASLATSCRGPQTPRPLSPLPP